MALQLWLTIKPSQIIRAKSSLLCSWLFTYIIQLSKSSNIRVVWCNSRKSVLQRSCFSSPDAYPCLKKWVFYTIFFLVFLMSDYQNFYIKLNYDLCSFISENIETFRLSDRRIVNGNFRRERIHRLSRTFKLRDLKFSN